MTETGRQWFVSQREGEKEPPFTGCLYTKVDCDRLVATLNHTYRGDAKRFSVRSPQGPFCHNVNTFNSSSCELLLDHDGPCTANDRLTDDADFPTLTAN